MASETYAAATVETTSAPAIVSAVGAPITNYAVAAPAVPVAAPITSYAAAAPVVSAAAPITSYAAPAPAYAPAAFSAAAPITSYAAAAPSVSYAAAPAVEYATATPGFGTVVGMPGLASSGGNIAFGTTAYQANLPALGSPLQVPQYQSVVAEQSGYVMPTTTTVAAGLPSSQSMIAYPGVSAMEGPFKFTSGATYQHGATVSTQVVQPAVAPTATAATTVTPVVATKPKPTKTKTKKGCC